MLEKLLLRRVGSCVNPSPLLVGKKAKLQHHFYWMYNTLEWENSSNLVAYAIGIVCYSLGTVGHMWLFSQWTRLSYWPVIGSSWFELHTDIHLRIWAESFSSSFPYFKNDGLVIWWAWADFYSAICFWTAVKHCYIMNRWSMMLGVALLLMVSLFKSFVNFVLLASVYCQ